MCYVYVIMINLLSAFFSYIPRAAHETSYSFDPSI